MEIQFLGGASEVGRLGMVFRRGPATLLFDYGMLPSDPPQYPIRPPLVDAVFLSHAHLDHSGMIPWICGRSEVDVVCTPPTADVADLLHLDSIKIADLEGFAAPYGARDVDSTRRSYRTMDFRDEVEIGGVEVSLHPAGHIPGATMFEVNAEKNVVFTGDLHTLTTELVRGARPVPCDVLVIESTYAGRRHTDRPKAQYEFLEKVRAINRRGGIALVPSFAVGRTQEVLLTLAKDRFNTWLDGMGKTVNSLYAGHPDYVRSAKKLHQAMRRVKVVRNRRGAGIALREADVIVCTSGMLDGGPVLHYLPELHKDKRNAILLTGFQVEGTNGRRLIEEGVVDVDGTDVKIACEWQKFDFSAHAGHDELLRFIEGCDPQTVVLMHGDSRELLAKDIEGREVVLPTEGDWYPL